MTTMADLMASLDKRPISVNRNDQVQGQVVSINEREIIVDLGTKAEGVLDPKDLTDNQLENLKVGDKITAYVINPEGPSGQVALSIEKATNSLRSKFGDQPKRWQKFIAAQKDKSVLRGKVLEQNKGGFMVEVEGNRGFVPSSQLSFANLRHLDTLVGQTIPVVVIEVDEKSNRLVLSTRGETSEETTKALVKFEVGQKVKGRVVAVFAFGAFLEVDGVEGFLRVTDASWDKIEDLTQVFEVGIEIEANIISKDPELGRVNLSVKELTSDPLQQIMEDFQPDDVVKGEVLEMTGEGVKVMLEKGNLEAVVPTENLDPEVPYTVGQSFSFLVDTVDKKKRTILLAPFITSTKGMIYK